MQGGMNRGLGNSTKLPELSKSKIRFDPPNFHDSSTETPGYIICLKSGAINLVALDATLFESKDYFDKGDLQVDFPLSI